MNDNDKQLLHQVHDLVDREHVLRAQLAEQDDPHREQDRAALTHVEEELDRCWDLLRQRRALQVVHRDPESALVRPVSQVENYLPLPDNRLGGA